jgi:hypothetical protein
MQESKMLAERQRKLMAALKKHYGEPSVAVIPLEISAKALGQIFTARLRSLFASAIEHFDPHKPFIPFGPAKDHAVLKNRVFARVLIALR